MKKLFDTANDPKQVFGENLDIQFNTTGSPLVDLVANGADIYIQKENPGVVQRFVSLCQKAAAVDLDMTVKIGRYFRDREKGQGLKEQPLLLIAALDGKLSTKQILSILAVFNEQKPGSVNLKTVDMSDLVKILAWHKYINSKTSDLSYELCVAFASIISNHKTPLIEVLRLKNREVAYNSNKTKQVSIIDIVGIIKGFKTPKLPDDVAQEYKVHLYPRHRNKQYYNIGTATKLAKEWRDYFNGNLEAGYIPEGITFDKVLCTNRAPDIIKMLEDGRISTAQLKVNMQKLCQIAGTEKVAKLMATRNISMFPHDLYAMAKAFKYGTTYTKADYKKMTIVEEMFKSLLAKYRTECTKNVVILGDTSGSMDVLLSEKGSVTRSEFSGFMSYFASLVCQHKVFGIWDSDARLFQATSEQMGDFLSNVDRLKSNANTNVINAIVSTGKHFSDNKKEAPEYICLISDMQFDMANTYHAMKGVSNSIVDALTKYKKITGVEAQLIFWNVAAPTSPCTTDANGVLCMGGFSAANADMLFGLVEKKGKLEVNDIISHINNYYND